jgi:hypothetical protein
MQIRLQQTLTTIPKAILVIGVLGNICNIIVFSKKTMRSTSTFRFLLYLSIVDMLVLLVGATDMLIRNDNALELREFSIFACNLHKFLTYTLTYVSSFVSVAVNVDRAQIVAGISMFHMGNITRNNTLVVKVKRKKQQQKWQERNRCICATSSTFKKHRLVDYIVVTIVISMVVLNSHYVTFLKTSSIIYVDYEDEDFYESNLENSVNSNNLTIAKTTRLNVSIFKNSEEKFKAFLRFEFLFKRINF